MKKLITLSDGSTVERWYDRCTRSWVVQTKDKEGNQIGEADYVGVKDHAVILMKQNATAREKELQNN